MEPRFDVNAEEGELHQEMRLAEPLLWESEFPPEAEKKGMIKEMNSMKEFDVYDEVMVKDALMSRSVRPSTVQMGQGLEE